MLTHDIANHLIRRFEQSTNYKISIVDNNGIILACKNKDRIGTFHKEAYHLIANSLLDFTCSSGLEGDEGGVILTINHGNTAAGAVEILGPPERVREPAQLLKGAVEELLEMQAQYERQSLQSTLSGRFCEQLLYTTVSDLPHLEVRARMLGYHLDCPRIPLMIVPLKEQHQNLVETLCRESEATTSQDIVTRPVGVQTLVFFRLQEARSLCTTYREQVEGYLSPILAQLNKRGIPCKCIAGSIQNRLDRYQLSFQHCMWISKHVSTAYPLYSIAYFYDHVYEYLHSKIDPDELSGVFEAYAQYESEAFWADFVPIVSAMNRNQNNMIKSSEELHMHKNTLAYRYKQIRTQLALDPLQHAADNFFTTELCYYLKNK